MCSAYYMPSIMNNIKITSPINPAITKYRRFTHENESYTQQLRREGMHHYVSLPAISYTCKKFLAKNCVGSAPASTALTLKSPCVYFKSSPMRQWRREWRTKVNFGRQKGTCQNEATLQNIEIRPVALFIANLSWLKASVSQ